MKNISPSTYNLLDSGNFKKLEQIGPYRLVRPAAQAVWLPRLKADEWKKADAEFIRMKEGTGSWKKIGKALPFEWEITWGGATLMIRLTDFGHIGVFPEHHELALPQGGAFRLLNLFAYTGAVSIQAALQGADVVHCDASKTSVDWARKNADRTKQNLPIRWIVDDVRKFLAREVRRGTTYHGVVLDPPSFGRGAKAEVWKIEDDLGPLLADIKSVLAPDFSFVKLSAHTPGYTPLSLKNLLMDHFGDGSYDAFEMVITDSSGRQLPSGACSVLRRDL